MDQIFNELSAGDGYADKYAASQGMERLMRLTHQLSQCGFHRVLRVVEGFSQLTISPGYTMSQWGRDRTIGADRDLQRLFLTVTGKSPYIEQFLADAEDNALIEFKYQNQIAFGLGLAYLWGSAALSLDGDVRFTQPSIDMVCYQLRENTESNEMVSVRLIYSIESLVAACSALQEKQIAGIDNGKQLIAKMSALFTHIACGVEAVKQLSYLTGSEQFFPEIIRHLSILNTTMEQWRSGPFEPKGLTWSPESESTSNQFSASRQFVCQDAVNRQFSLHTKMKSANQRIYYFPEFDKRVVHIGYVGVHLPTTKFKA
jgi:hypothetical protein